MMMNTPLPTSYYLTLAHRLRLAAFCAELLATQAATQAQTGKAATQAQTGKAAAVRQAQGEIRWGVVHPVRTVPTKAEATALASARAWGHIS